MGFYHLQLNKVLIKRYDFKYLPLNYSKILLKLHSSLFNMHPLQLYLLQEK